MGSSTFVYASYIRTTQKELWSALTNADSIRHFWFGNRLESEWTAGSSWRNLSPGGEVLDEGEILEVEPLQRLTIRWRHTHKPELTAEGESRCSMELEAFGSAVRLTITHSIQRERSLLIEAVAAGWPKVISNLKSWLETGAIALHAPYPIESQRSLQE